MTRTLTFVLCMACVSVSFGQVDFAPVGSEWIYGYDNLTIGNKGAQIVKCVKDSLIEGVYYRHLEYTDYDMYSDGYFVTLETRHLLLREEAKKVYRWVDGEEFLFFDFTLEIGDSYFSSYSPDEYVLDSITSLEVLGENTLTYHYTTCHSGEEQLLSVNNHIGPLTHIFSHPFYPCNTNEIDRATIGAYNWMGDNHVFDVKIHEYNLHYNGRLRKAFFETPFYFEDAAGNRDTVIVASDPDARYLQDEQFGVYNISMRQTADKFEVRLDGAVSQAFDDFYRYDYSSKKHVSWARGFWYNPDCFVSNTPIFFLISGAEEPVKISWDKAYWIDNLCTSASSLILNDGPLIDFHWEPDPYGVYSHCLSKDGYFDFNFNYQRQFDFYQRDPIESDTVFWVQLYYFGLGSELQCGTFTSTTKLQFDDIQLYPNPTTNLIWIRQHSDFSHYQIFDSEGNSITKGQLTSDTIYFEDRADGVYFLRLKGHNGKTYIKQIIKI